MRKIILCLFLLAFSAAACHAQEFQFRNAFWGMTQAEVKAAETGKLMDGDAEQAAPTLVFTVAEPVFGLNGAKAYYIFSDAAHAEALNFELDRLLYCGYMFLDYAGNDAVARKDFQQIIAALNERYGEPQHWEFDESVENENVALEGYMWTQTDYYVVTNLVRASENEVIYVSYGLNPTGPTWLALQRQE